MGEKYGSVYSARFEARPDRHSRRFSLAVSAPLFEAEGNCRKKRSPRRHEVHEKTLTNPLSASCLRAFVVGSFSCIGPGGVRLGRQVFSWFPCFLIPPLGRRVEPALAFSARLCASASSALRWKENRLRSRGRLGLRAQPAPCNPRNLWFLLLLVLTLVPALCLLLRE